MQMYYLDINSSRASLGVVIMEPLNKGHIGIRSTVPCMGLSLLNFWYIIGCFLYRIRCRDSYLAQKEALVEE